MDKLRAVVRAVLTICFREHYRLRGGYLMKRAIITRAIGVFLIGLLPVVAGCSGQDIQFEGKVFDAMGISGPAARPKDKKMAERAPLVMPPQ